LFGTNLVSLFLLYGRPVKALGRILDQGRVWFSVITALAVSLLLHATDGPPVRDLDMTLAVLLRIISLQPGSWLFPIGVVAVILAPAILLVRAVSGSGSFGVLMQSDYAGLLNCVLMTWSAAYLPLALAGLTGLPAVHTFPVFAMACLYFIVLTALSVRTVFGTSLATGAGMAVGGSVAMLLGGIVFLTAGSMLRFLMSPLLLYYAYIMLGTDVRSLGEGLRSRQRLRQQLEIATNNPRDADAHYQLGLIYQKRRQYTEALARFRRAVEIDSTEADAHLQLGRIALEQSRFEDAIGHLEIAVRLDDKLSLSEVWRELGAAYLGASRVEDAGVALAKFTDRRAYDPEGLYRYGVALKKLGRTAEAREMFDRSMEAVRTMPPHRRAELRKWSGLARTELRGLKMS
jgi:tetratricopeptide (TPR) repeat protein